MSSASGPTPEPAPRLAFPQVPTTFDEQLLFATTPIKNCEGRIYGTGFYYADSNRTFIITCLHVIDSIIKDDDQPDKFVCVIRPKGQKPREVEIKQTGIYMHPDEDLVLIHIDVSSIGELATLFLTPQNIITDEKFLQERSVVEPVRLFGYQDGLYDENDAFPTVRVGYTASHPGLDIGGRPRGRLNITAYRGESGSPIIIPPEMSYQDKSTGALIIGHRGAVLLGVYTGGYSRRNGSTPQGQSLALGHYIKARSLITSWNSYKYDPRRATSYLKIESEGLGVDLHSAGRQWEGSKLVDTIEVTTYDPTFNEMKEITKMKDEIQSLKSMLDQLLKKTETSSSSKGAVFTAIDKTLRSDDVSLDLTPEDGSSQTSGSNWGLLHSKYGDPSYFCFKPANFGLSNGYTVVTRWGNPTNHHEWSFLGFRWGGPRPTPSPNSNDAGFTLTTDIINHLRLPISSEDLPFERDHRNLIIDQEAHVLQRGSQNTWSTSREPGDFKEDYEDEERNLLMQRLRRQYNEFVTQQPTPAGLQYGCYIVVEDGKEARIYKSYAHAAPLIGNQYTVFGCTYYGLSGNPLKIRVAAVGGIYPNPDTKLFFGNDEYYSYNFGYVRMRFYFTPKPMNKPTKPSMLQGFFTNRKDYEAKKNKYEVDERKYNRYLERGGYTKTCPDTKMHYIDIKMMIDTGATTCLGPQSVLCNLGLIESDIAAGLRGFDGKTSKGKEVKGFLELVDQVPLSPKVKIGTDICFRVSTDEKSIDPSQTALQYDVDAITNDIKFSDDWILGQNYLKFFQHLWTANSYVDFKLIPQYSHPDGSFNVESDCYEHNTYEDRDRRIRLISTSQ